jgi:hypothetical protein
MVVIFSYCSLIHYYIMFIMQTAHIFATWRSHVNLGGVIYWRKITRPQINGHECMILTVWHSHSFRVQDTTGLLLLMMKRSLESLKLFIIPDDPAVSNLVKLSTRTLACCSSVFFKSWLNQFDGRWVANNSLYIISSQLLLTLLELDRCGFFFCQVIWDSLLISVSSLSSDMRALVMFSLWDFM